VLLRLSKATVWTLLLGELLNLLRFLLTSGHQISGVSDDPSFEQMTVCSVKNPGLY